MTDHRRTPTRRWPVALTYLVLAAALIVAPLLPLDMTAPAFGAPDLLLVVTAAWVARRPDTLPAPVVAGVFLLADLLFQRPPGLYAALVLLMTERLRRRSGRLRKGTFPGEWFAAGAGIAVVALANYAILGMFGTPQAPFRFTLVQMALGISLYPVVAGVAHVTLGLHRPAQGEVDALGHRL